MQTAFAPRLGVGTILALVLSVTAAPAQTTLPTDAWSRLPFIEVSAIADYDRTDLEPAGPARAIGLGIGSRLWRRYSVRFEFDRPGDHVGLDQEPGFEHRWTSKTTSYAFLLGRHFRTAEKIQIVVLAGLSALTHRSDLTGFIDIRPRDGTPPTHNVLDEQIREQWVGLTLGLEAPVAITSHLRLVPQLRLHQVANSDIDGLFPSGKQALRPRLSLRWEF